MDVWQIIVLAIMAEAIWETLKLVWQKDKFHPDVLGSLLIGIILALSTGLNLFEMVGLPIVNPYLGQIFTGILASRGANFVHDLVKVAQGMRIRVNSNHS
ncbi:MAG TPA: hypothetical protein PLG09_09600 [Syntrophomonadaceae bacterium]|nr:hypothetical protein [Syntrophomonadaceae bacterium]HPU49521.1 hypothetical protein [Syntrophomonadaceae bacterium]